MSNVDAIKRLSKSAEQLNDGAAKLRVEAEQARAYARSTDDKAATLEAQALALEKSIETLEVAALDENVLTLKGKPLPEPVRAFANGGFITGTKGDLFGAGQLIGTHGSLNRPASNLDPPRLNDGPPSSGWPAGTEATP